MKRRIFTGFLVCFLVSFSMVTNLQASTTDLADSVVTLDPIFEEYLRSSCFYDLADEEPITELMMLNVITVSTAFCVYNENWECTEIKQITDFTGIEYAKNLSGVMIQADLSEVQNYSNIEALNNLENLQTVTLDCFDDYTGHELTEDEKVTVKTTLRNFLDQFGNENTEEIGIGYNLRMYDANYSWLEGIDLSQKAKSLRASFQEMPIIEAVEFREFGTNEQGEKLYKMTYHNPVHAIYVDDDGILKTDTNYDFMHTFVMNYGGQQIDDSLINLYDEDANLLEVVMVYEGVENFSYLEVIICESQLEEIDTDSPLLTLSTQQRSGGGVLPTLNIHNLISLYLNPTTTLFSLVYDENGATSGVAPEDTNEYEDGDSATLLDEGTLEKSGHTFTGWNTNSLGTGDIYQPGDGFIMSEDTTLYAMWEEEAILFSLFYDKNGATSGVVPEDTNEYEDGDSAILLDEGTLAKSGHTFAGWNTNDLGTGDTYQPGDGFIMSEDTTLYAMWTSTTTTTYSVTYNGNGHTSGKVPLDTNVYNIDDVVTVLSGSELKRDGYVFSGWNTEPDGSGINYVENDTFSITIGSPMTRATVSYTTLYAQWSKKNIPLIPEETSKPSIEAPMNKGNNVSTADTTNVHVLLGLSVISMMIMLGSYLKRKHIKN